MKSVGEILACLLFEVEGLSSKETFIDPISSIEYCGVQEMRSSTDTSVTLYGTRSEEIPSSIRRIGESYRIFVW